MLRLLVFDPHALLINIVQRFNAVRHIAAVTLWIIGIPLDALTGTQKLHRYLHT